MSTPMPRCRRPATMVWMSCTAIGSTPANGSSSSMNLGSVTSARVISRRRRSPPESWNPFQRRQPRVARVGAEHEELLAVGDGQLAERGAARLIRHAGQRGGGERERRIPCRHQIGEVPGGNGRCHGPGFFFVVAVVLVVSAFFVVSVAGGRGSSWTPSAAPVTVHRSTLSPFRAQSMILPRE